MGNYFNQIRRQSGLNKLVKELADKLAAANANQGDAESSMRLLRTNNDDVVYDDTGTAYLESAELSKTDTDVHDQSGIVPVANILAGTQCFVMEDTNVGNMKFWSRADRGTAADESGSNLTVTPGSAVTATSAGYLFPGSAGGSNSNIVVTDDAAIRVGANFSVFARIYATTLTSDTVVRRVLCKSDDANNGYIVLVNTAGRPAFNTKRAGSSVAVEGSDGDVTINNVFHIGFTYNAGTIIGYVNGVQKTTSAGIATFPDSAALQIGRQLSSGVSEGRFQGYIWDVRFYNTTLSSTEVNNLYQGYSRYGQAAICALSEA